LCTPPKDSDKRATDRGIVERERGRLRRRIDAKHEELERRWWDEVDREADQTAREAAKEKILFERGIVAGWETMHMQLLMRIRALLDYTDFSMTEVRGVPDKEILEAPSGERKKWMPPQKKAGKKIKKRVFA